VVDLSVHMFASVSVGHVPEACKNGLTDRDSVWDEDLGVPKVYPVLEGGRDLARERALTFAEYIQKALSLKLLASAIYRCRRNHAKFCRNRSNRGRDM